MNNLQNRQPAYNGRIFIVLGGMLAALAVGLGAFGVHGLKGLVEEGRFSAHDLETFQTAVQYQMMHAIGLILIGLLAHVRPSDLLTLAGWIMFFAILIFSGFLYAYVGTGVKVFAMIVPIGGLAFMISWICLAIAAIGKG